jgi:hypothetical protein
MDIVKVVCVKIPSIVLITGLVGAALCISERLYLVFPAVTMECRYYNNMMQQSVYVHYFLLLLLESSRSFFRKVLSSSFTVVLSTECLHALDLGLGSSLFGMSVLALLK